MQLGEEIHHRLVLGFPYLFRQSSLSAIGHTPVYVTIISVHLHYTYIMRAPGLNVPEYDKKGEMGGSSTAELEITVGYRTFSDHFFHLSEQSRDWMDIVSKRFI